MLEDWADTHDGKNRTQMYATDDPSKKQSG